MPFFNKCILGIGSEVISGDRKAGNSVTFKDQCGFRIQLLLFAAWMKDYLKKAVSIKDSSGVGESQEKAGRGLGVFEVTQ